MREYCVSNAHVVITDDVVLEALEKLGSRYMKTCFQVISGSRKKQMLQDCLTKQQLIKYIQYIDNQDTTKPKCITALSLLHEHLNELFHSEEYSDVILVSNDGRETKAHSFILAKIPKLKLWLEQSNRIEIEVDGHLLLLILEFLYTSSVFTAEDLIAVINSTFDANLCQMAEDQLLKALDSYKAADILSLCTKNNIKRSLKEKCMRIIVNKASKDELVELLMKVK